MESSLAKNLYFRFSKLKKSSQFRLNSLINKKHREGFRNAVATKIILQLRYGKVYKSASGKT